MWAPIRLLGAARPTVGPGLLGATAVSTIVFSATPLVLPEVATTFDVSLGSASWMSAAQLGGFVVSSWTAGRVARPSRRLFVLALVVLAGANLVTAATGSFAVLVASRAISGTALGALTWLAWSEVFGSASRMADVAVVGPLAGVVASPVIGLVIDQWGMRWVYVGLAVAALVPLPWAPRLSGSAGPPTSTRHRPVPVATVLVAGLALLTLGGSAVFVYGGAIGSGRIGMSPFAVSLAYSANAAAGIPSARWRGARPGAGGWLVATAAAAVVLGVVTTAPAFWAAMVVWGFAFWMGVPGVFSLLADRSVYPAERVGDAQAAMAAGRVAGPLLGGVLVGTGSTAVLGLVGGGLVLAAAVTFLVVELRVPARASSSRPIV